MSEIYLQGFRHGEPAGAERDDVLGVVRLADPEYDLDGEEITLALASGPVVLDASIDEGVVYAITVRDPPAAKEFWDMIMGLLKIGPYVLYWPGGEQVAHGGAVGADDLPDDLIDSLGQLVAVKSGDELRVLAGR